jgi:hypothetical protein
MVIGGRLGVLARYIAAIITPNLVMKPFYSNVMKVQLGFYVKLVIILDKNGNQPTFDLKNINVKIAVS